MPAVGVGDVLATIELICVIVEAVEASRGSKQQYEDVIRVLRGSEQALQYITNLDLAPDDQAAIKEVAEAYQRTLLSFTQYTKKYTATLGPNGRKGIPKFFKSIQWQRYARDDITRLQLDLGKHSCALQLLLLGILQ